MGLKLRNALIVALASIMNCIAMDVGDFAPFSVGNTWRYTGHDSENIVGRISKDSIDVLIKLNSKSISGDTIKFGFSISEKHFAASGNRIDTTINKRVSQIEIHDSILGGSDWGAIGVMYYDQLFGSHSYPDSLVKFADVNGSKQPIVCLESYGESKKCFVKDIGPTYIFSNPYSGAHATHTREFFIRELNGVIFKKPLVVAIGPIREIIERKKRKVTGFSMVRQNRFYILDNTVVNLLGRPVPH